MTTDAFLAELRRRHLLLVSECEIWPASQVPQKLQKTIQRHRPVLTSLLAMADVRVCASPTWHRPYYKYTGNHQFVCEACQRFL